MPYRERYELLESWTPALAGLLTDGRVLLAPVNAELPSRTQYTVYELLHTIGLTSAALRSADPPPHVRGYGAELVELIHAIAAMREYLSLRITQEGQVEVLDRRLHTLRKRGRAGSSSSPSPSPSTERQVERAGSRRYTPEHALSSFIPPETKLQGSVGEADLALLRRLAREQDVLVLAEPDLSPITLVSASRLREQGYPQELIEELFNASAQQNSDTDSAFSTLAPTSESSPEGSSSHTPTA